jgi:hypothetical protein
MDKNSETKFGADPQIELTVVERMNRMFKLASFFSFEDIKEEGPDTDGPVGVDYNERLKRFEEALGQAVITAPADREFNLKLDRKLEEYRIRQKRSEEEIESKRYKDSLYKLIIANYLRIEGVVKLEDAYKNVEDFVGEGRVDMELFKNAWKVIRSYAEGQAHKILGGTGF